MARLSELDIYEIRQFFEEALTRAQRTDKREKMRMRRKIRDEVFNLLTWEKPSPSAIMNRWEERLHDVFLIMPYGFKEDLFHILSEKMLSPLQKKTF